MAIKNISETTNDLIKYWKKQNIPVDANSIEKIYAFEIKSCISLPEDFKKFYLLVNGMGNFYPNHTDLEGFLFYPLEAIVSSKIEFKNSGLTENNKLYLFADYMQKSWWYGVEVDDENHYIIGIIPDENTFKPITNSLSEFILLYIQNSPRLYDLNTNQSTKMDT